MALAATVPVLQGCRPLVLSASERGVHPEGGRRARWSRDLPFLSEQDVLDRLLIGPEADVILAVNSLPVRVRRRCVVVRPVRVTNSRAAENQKSKIVSRGEWLELRTFFCFHPPLDSIHVCLRSDDAAARHALTPSPTGRQGPTPSS